MLAASNTGAIIAGIISVLIVIGLIALGFRVVVIAIKLLLRLVAWPFRALRPKPPTGAGADYEAMVRQQSREPAPVTGRPLPFPPPSGEWATPQPEAAESKVILPPPPYRAWEPEPDAPEPALAAAAQEPNASAPVSRWERLMTPSLIPAWLVMSLAWLGLWFLVSKPLVGSSWESYGVGLVFAVLVGVRTKLRTQSKLLWRAPRNAVYWMRWGKQDDSLPPPAAVQAAAEAVAATQAPDSETPVATP